MSSSFAISILTFFSAVAGIFTWNLFQIYALPYLASLCRRRGTKNDRFVPVQLNSSSHTTDFCGSLNGNCSFIDSDAPVPLTFDQEVEAFEKATGTSLLFLYHAEGGLFGSNSLDINDANKFVTSLRKIDNQKNLTIILNTPGGTVHAAEIIINALRNHEGLINIYVPFYACSSGTMIALAGDRLFLGQNAHLTPFDPVLGAFGIGAKNVLSALPDDAESAKGSFLSPVYRGLTATAKRAMTRIYHNLTDRIAVEKFSTEQADRIREEMIDGNVAHDTPFFFSDLSYLGDYISCSIPDDVYAIYDKFLGCRTSRRGSNPIMSMLGM